MPHVCTATLQRITEEQMPQSLLTKIISTDYLASSNAMPLNALCRKYIVEKYDANADATRIFAVKS